jgi:hypothetical protein
MGQGDLRDKVHLEPIPASRAQEKPPGDSIVAANEGRAASTDSCDHALAWLSRQVCLWRDRLPCPVGLVGSPHNSRRQLAGVFQQLVSHPRTEMRACGWARTANGAEGVMRFPKTLGSRLGGDNEEV